MQTLGFRSTRNRDLIFFCNVADIKYDSVHTCLTNTFTSDNSSNCCNGHWQRMWCEKNKAIVDIKLHRYSHVFLFHFTCIYCSQWKKNPLDFINLCYQKTRVHRSLPYVINCTTRCLSPLQKITEMTKPLLLKQKKIHIATNNNNCQLKFSHKMMVRNAFAGEA